MTDKTGKHEILGESQGDAKPYYTPSSQIRLRRALAKVHPKYNSLLIHFTARRSYRTERGKELAVNGLMRRLKVMVRCIENVFRILPLEGTSIPDATDLHDATINVHAFILNVFGAVDNVAGILTNELGIIDKKGRLLSAGQIGLAKKHDLLRNGCSPEFRDYINSRDNWLAYIEDFRHALAHRIPPYFPPYRVLASSLSDYQAIEEKQARVPVDSPKYEQLEAEKQKFARFVPEILHSFIERSKTVTVHTQLLADFNTIEELAYKADVELDRFKRPA